MTSVIHYTYDSDVSMIEPGLQMIIRKRKKTKIKRPLLTRSKYMCLK